MELIVKHFSELSAEELFEIYKLRISVFVVEQNCPYQEADDADRAAYHVWLKDETGIKAYARVLPPGVTFDSAAIGRVIAVKRRCGLGSIDLSRISYDLMRSILQKKNLVQIKSLSKRRLTHAVSMKKQVFTKHRKNFWKMVFRISGCS